MRRALHHSFVQATAGLAAIVARQIGTAFAARTEHVSLRQIGVLSNPLLLRGVAFEQGHRVRRNTRCPS